ncbi:MAG: carboxypeptidase-like regulatory domain-containing protein, partial [Flavisolibacter sp.]|nr:carboxypeptidase-like regulatory domain-containing protein [Flavisolibacter sp.]
MQKSTCRNRGKRLRFRKIVLIMKLSLVFLVFALHVSATNYGQKMLSLNEKDITLTDIFKKIERKYQFKFYFSNDVVADRRFTTIHTANATIEEVMSNILNGSGLYWKLLPGDKIVIGSNDLNAKSADARRIITGVVKDNKGTPISNVSVTIKGSTTGVTTAENGRFSINANKGDVLVFSSIGYQTQEVKIADQESIDLVLLVTENNLNEVVVVAYGTQKKINLTGAVDQISGKEIQDRPVVNVTDALQGKIANLNITTGYSGGAPDATKSINVRGYSGFNYSNGTNNLAGPLVIIDGSEGNINSVNPNDIESISLLKDAASSAVYG